MPNGSFRRMAAMVSVVVAASLTLAQSPAMATVAVSHLKAVAAPATVRVGGTVVVTGSLTPKGVVSVSLQRLVGTKWATVAHGKTTKTGSYALSLHASRSTGTMTLRVARRGTSTAKAAVSSTLHVRVVKTAFKVTALSAATALTTAQAFALHGKVTPKATGSVSLDKAVGSKWVSLAKVKLTKSSTYAFSTSLPAGSYKLRVSKSFSRTVAGGVSAPFRLVVTIPVAPPTLPPAPANPVVTTTALASMVVSKPTTTTLAATLGTAPYSWAVLSGTLPPGLSLVTSGTISGTPKTVGVSSFTVRVTDALGHSGTGTINATVSPVVVRAWGTNNYDELGTDGGDPDTIVITAAPNSVSAVAGGYRYALALESDGSVWAWGTNDQGELGLGDITSRNVPTRISTLSDIVAIAAGRTSAYAVNSAGLLYAWGANGSGELGDGTTTERDLPVLVPTLSNIVSVAAGDRFVLALDGLGQVHSWGDGENGTLGNGLHTLAQTTPGTTSSLGGPAVAVSASRTAGYAVLADGTVKAWGLKEHSQLGHVETPSASPDDPSPVPVDDLTGVTAISCTGMEFCLALRQDGTVSAWGYDQYGEMGNGSANVDVQTAAAVPGLSHVVGVATADQTGFALHADGTVSSWGYDYHNILGSGDPNDVATSSPATIPGLTKVFRLAAGYEDAYALTG